MEPQYFDGLMMISHPFGTVRLDHALNFTGAPISLDWYETSTVILRDFFRKEYRAGGPLPRWPRNGFANYMSQLCMMPERRLVDYSIAMDMWFRDTSHANQFRPAHMTVGDQLYVSWLYHLGVNRRDLWKR